MERFTHWLNVRDSESEGVVLELYAELKKIAAARMAAERPGRTLNVTALVHEAWMRIEKSSPRKWRDRRQYFAAASEAMRRILVEAARRRIAAKRGGGEENIPLEGLEISMPVTDERLLAIHDSLDRLESEDELKARIVKLRYFSGMDHHEIAALLDVNEKTVRRHWELAKVWLYKAIHGGV